MKPYRPKQNLPKIVFQNLAQVNNLSPKKSYTIDGGYDLTNGI